MQANGINRSSWYFFSHDQVADRKCPLSLAQKILFGIGTTALFIGTLAAYKFSSFAQLSPQMVTLSFAVTVVALLLLLAVSKPSDVIDKIEGRERCPLNYPQKLIAGIGLSAVFIGTLSYKRVALFGYLSRQLATLTVSIGLIALLFASTLRRTPIMSESPNNPPLAAPPAAATGGVPVSTSAAGGAIETITFPKPMPVVSPSDFPDLFQQIEGTPSILAVGGAAVGAGAGVATTLLGNVTVPAAVTPAILQDIAQLRIVPSDSRGRIGELSPDPGQVVKRTFKAALSAAAYPAAGAGAGAHSPDPASEGLGFSDIALSRTESDAGKASDSDSDVDVSPGEVTRSILDAASLSDSQSWERVEGVGS